mmetsp:Transcript_103304/g.333212  ORF Transcript_103304/g.333212 Transcript_103304/m.333212 type:complete len:298 (+) Transcript_103304:439-1332(+)
MGSGRGAGLGAQRVVGHNGGCAAAAAAVAGAALGVAGRAPRPARGGTAVPRARAASAADGLRAESGEDCGHTAQRLPGLLRAAARLQHLRRARRLRARPALQRRLGAPREAPVPPGPLSPAAPGQQCRARRDGGVPRGGRHAVRPRTASAVDLPRHHGLAALPHPHLRSLALLAGATGTGHGGRPRALPPHPPPRHRVRRDPAALAPQPAAATVVAPAEPDPAGDGPVAALGGPGPSAAAAGLAGLRRSSRIALGRLRQSARRRPRPWRKLRPCCDCPAGSSCRRWPCHGGRPLGAP